jgi:hypothetical protein
MQCITVFHAEQFVDVSWCAPMPVYEKVGKISKPEAGYVEISKYPPKIRSCGICDHFYRGTLGGMCEIVRGKIAPGGGCSLFSPEVIPCDVLEK